MITLISTKTRRSSPNAYGESTIADAIMDRLAVNAHRIDLKGESLRKKI